MVSTLRLTVAGLAAGLATLCAAAEPPFELKEGDRVVFLGDRLIEGTRDYGYLEAALTTRWPGRKITFQNLGWSGDTVRGSARAGFGAYEDNRKGPWPPKHRERYGIPMLRRQLEDARPTVLFVAYGANAAYSDKEVERFPADLNRLLDELDKTAARIVLVSPTRHQQPRPALPDPAERNQRLQEITGILRKAAQDRHHRFVDLFAGLNTHRGRTDGPPSTENGIHLTHEGYRQMARAVVEQLELARTDWKLHVTADGKIVEAIGTRCKETALTKTGLKFETSDTLSPMDGDERDRSRVLRISDLKQGRYSLSIDGRRILTAAADEWAKGVAISHGPDFDQIERLRETIVTKNRLLFHHFRPQNDMYIRILRLYGREEHTSAVEEWGRLVEEKESEIARLSALRLRRYEVNREAIDSGHYMPSSVPKPGIEEELKSFKVAEGFQVNLFASNPMIRKPLNLNWDAQGRAWVSSSTTYPQMEPGDEPRDQIIVLEDTDHDGRADRSTVFADSLRVPHSVVPGNGGVYVAQSTAVLHLQDSDGDGRADQRRAVLPGFGNTDSSHTIHTLRWGPGGHLYFNQSVYIDSHVETPWGVRRLTSGGIWRFRPETGRLEVYSHGLCNSWGHAFDRWGQSFATDGCAGGGIFYEFPGAAYRMSHNIDRTIPEPNPGHPKACGLEMASGRHLPESWRGTFITTDFRANRVIRYKLSEKGSGYLGKLLPDLLTSSHTTFRPIDVKMGPDGAIYVVDFYEPIIGHGGVDFHHPWRDHAHGRIWRISARDRPLVTPPELAGASVEALLEALKLPEDWTRDQARRLLRESGAAAVVPALREWLASLDSNDPDYEHQRLEALWVFQGVRHVDAELLHQLLISKDHRVRAAAVRVLSYWSEHIPDAMKLLAGAVTDEHPRVRLEGVCALRQIPSSESAKVAMQVLDKPKDEYIDFITWSTARQLEELWLPHLKSGNPIFDEPGHLAFALAAVNKPEALKPLVDLYRQGKIAEGNRQQALRVIAALGAQPELQMILDLATAKVPTNPSEAAVLLSTLEKNAHREETRPEKLQGLVILLDADDEPVRLATAALLGRWKVAAARKRLVALTTERETSTALRQTAARALARLGGPEIEKQLETLAGGDQPIEVRTAAVAAWAHLDAARAAPSAVELLQAMPDDGDATPLFEAFIGREEGAVSLVKALAEKQLSSQIAATGIHLARFSGREMPELIEVLTSAGALKPLPPELTPEASRKLLADLERLGSAERGEAVYRRAELNCMTCHAISGAGGLLGPDLASIGSTATPNELVQSLLEPSAKIKQNYETASVRTTDGVIFSGVVRRQSDREIVLFDGSAKTHVIPTSQIDEVHVSDISLMPKGLTALLRRDELVDLLRFLSELGKGAYRATTEPVVRTWRVLKPSDPLEQRLQSSPDALLEKEVEQSNWLPAYGTVAGYLPLTDLPRFANNRLSAGRFHLDVTTAGRVGLQFEDPAGLRLWVDGMPLAAGRNVTMTLPEGQHSVTVVIDRAKRTTPLRATLVDVPNSPGRAHLTSGQGMEQKTP
ncbi:MAG: sorbosone dehydrogenase [Roseibacillus sp.]|jgi:putative heme-binding domain-containing protein|nr:sorbosone dehydrogenase [Roseibacillus sp.]MDP7308016.1 HEAT repeat domain-containing protein [Roseibacillus sp.]HJM65636.1 PVC-type heme-binding CxxCH protein [Roseibacillus sp.]|tara:strand:+ start:1316 stop:5947 length:4632 start_codon:yes stop_codon:yes gene_type:complete